MGRTIDEELNRLHRPVIAAEEPEDSKIMLAGYHVNHQVFPYRSQKRTQGHQRQRLPSMETLHMSVIQDPLRNHGHAANIRRTYYPPDYSQAHNLGKVDYPVSAGYPSFASQTTAFVPMWTTRAYDMPPTYSLNYYPGKIQTDDEFVSAFY